MNMSNKLNFIYLVIALVGFISAVVFHSISKVEENQYDWYIYPTNA